MIDPMKDMCEGLDLLREITTAPVAHLLMLKDQAIAQALQAIQPLWTSDEIARRCVFVRCVGKETEELFVDGVMVIRFEPPEAVQQWHDDRLVITYTQKFKRVQAVKL